MIKAPDLAPDYYLKNFQFLINWVEARYEDILSLEEKAFVAAFGQLSHDSQCLFVRLASRKGPIFRAEKLCYSEINCLIDAAKHLLSNDLMYSDLTLSLSDLANLLTKTELLDLFPSFSKSERKSDLVERLTILYPTPRKWGEWTNGKLGQIYSLNTQDILKHFKVLFFGNAYQDLTEFVLQDIGLFRYENYAIDHQHRVFKSREELLHYQHLIALREQLALATTLEQLTVISEQIPNLVASESLRRRKAKLCNQLAYRFEQHNEYDVALSLYEQSHMTPSRERQIRLWEKQKKYIEAWRLLESVLQAPIDEQELQVAERMLPRLAKKAGKAHTPKPHLPLAEKALTLPKYVDEHGGSSYVEEIVRSHFDSEAAPCLYVENQLLVGLFGLWLWPEMFRGLDGAFANPFQSAPLDMYEHDFIEKRPVIVDLFNLFEDSSHKQHIYEMWQLKQGLSNHFVNWNFLDEQTLLLALNIIPGQHLKLIFKRILFDLRNNRSGFPDLIQFFPSTKDYLMIEVKGPGDRIQDNQRRWMNFFHDNKIPAEVVYVSWQ